MIVRNCRFEGHGQRRRGPRGRGVRRRGDHREPVLQARDRGSVRQAARPNKRSRRRSTANTVYQARRGLMFDLTPPAPPPAPRNRCRQVRAGRGPELLRQDAGHRARRPPGEPGRRGDRRPTTRTARSPRQGNLPLVDVWTARSPRCCRTPTRPTTRPSCASRRPARGPRRTRSASRTVTRRPSSPSYDSHSFRTPATVTANPSVVFIVARRRPAA